MITLRTKTTRRLNEANCRILIDTIAKILQHKNNSEVEEWIWKLTYIPTELAKELGFEENLSLEDIHTIRNEIASQYRNAQKDWGYGKEEFFGKQYEENKAYQELKKSISDRYALNEIVRACERCIRYSTPTISKTIGCLRSNWDTSHDKGFEILLFKKEEQEYFIDSRTQIAAFLESLCIDKLEKYREEKIKWREETAEDSETETVQKATKKNKEDVVHMEEKVVGMTARELLIERANIEAFFKAVAKVENPKWLLENRDKIETFFKVCDQF